MTTLAFFDLDYTLLSVSSGKTYVRAMIRQRRIPLLRAAYTTVRYQLKLIDFGVAHLDLISYVGKGGQTATANMLAGWTKENIIPYLAPAGIERVNWHKAQGHHVLLISASIDEIVRVVAQHLDVEYRATRFAVRDDRYTGTLDGPLCYEAGKLFWVDDWCRSHGFEFDQAETYFYSDSPADLPLLERVTRPVAVNPAPKLAKVAQQRGWPVEKFY